MRNRLLVLLCAVAGAHYVLSASVAEFLVGALLWVVSLTLIAPDMDRLFPGGEFARRVLGAAFFLSGLYACASVSEFWAIGLLCFGAALFSPDMAGFAARPTRGFFFPSGAASGALRDYSHAQRAVTAGDYEAAARAYRRYADEDPDDQRVRLELARLYARMQDRSAALYWFEKVIAYQARNELEALALREQIALHLAAGDLPRARTAWDALRRDFPEHAHTRAARNLLSFPQKKVAKKSEL